MTADALSFQDSAGQFNEGHDHEHHHHDHTKTSVILEAKQTLKATQVVEEYDDYDGNNHPSVGFFGILKKIIPFGQKSIASQDHHSHHHTGGEFHGGRSHPDHDSESDIQRDANRIGKAYADSQSSDDEDTELRNLREKFEREYKAAQRKADAKVKSAQHKFGQTGQAIKEDAEDAYDSLKNKAGEYEDYVEGKAHDAKRAGSHAAKKIYHDAQSYTDDAKDTASSVVDTATHGAKQAAHHISKGAHNIKQDVHDAAAAAAKKADQAAQNAKKAAHQVGKGAHGLKEDAKDSISHMADTASQNAKDAVQHITKGAQHVKQQAEDYVEDKYEKVKENLEDAVDDTVAGAKHAKHKIDSTLSSVNNGIKNKIAHGKHFVEDKAHQVGDGFRTGAQALKDSAHSAKQSAEAKMHDIHDKVEEQAHALWKTTNQCAQCLGLTGPRSNGGFVQVQHHTLRPTSYAFEANPVPATAFWVAISSLWFLWLINKVWQTPTKYRTQKLTDSVTTSIVSTEDKKSSDAKSKEHVPSPSKVHQRSAKSSEVSTTPAAVATQETLQETSSTLEIPNTMPVVSNLCYLVLHLLQLGVLEMSGMNRPFLHLLSFAFLLTSIAHGEGSTFQPFGFDIRPAAATLQRFLIALAAASLASRAVTSGTCGHL